MRGQVTILARDPMTRAEAYQVVVTALNVYGYTAINELGGEWRATFIVGDEPALIADYYRHAPALVAAIDAAPDAARILDAIYAEARPKFLQLRDVLSKVVVVDPIRESSGKLLGFAKITRDLTIPRLAEERLAHEARHHRIGGRERVVQAAGDVLRLDHAVQKVDGQRLPGRDVGLDLVVAIVAEGDAHRLDGRDGALRMVHREPRHHLVRAPAQLAQHRPRVNARGHVGADLPGGLAAAEPQSAGCAAGIFMAGQCARAKSCH